MVDSGHEFILEGSKVRDLDSFWDEMSRTVLADANWIHSLPGFDSVLGARTDLLRGATIRWVGAEHSRHSLGHAATLRWLEGGARRLTPEKAELISREIERAKRGQGATLFDMLVETMRRRGILVELA